MNLYSPEDCEKVRKQWNKAYQQFLAFGSGEICFLSNPNIHFGKYRYVVNTDYLRI